MPPPGRPLSRQASPSPWVRGGANSGVCEDEPLFHGAPAGARYGLRPDPADQAEPTRCARVSVVVSARSGIVRRASSPAVGEIGRRTVSASFDDLLPTSARVQIESKNPDPSASPWQEPAILALLQDSFFAYQSLVEPPELEPLSILIIPWPSLASAAANPRRAAASRRYPSLHQPLDSRRLWCLAVAMQLCVWSSCAPAQCMR